MGESFLQNEIDTAYWQIFSVSEVESADTTDVLMGGVVGVSSRNRKVGIDTLRYLVTIFWFWQVQVVATASGTSKA